MRRIVPLALAAAVVGLAASSSHAAITASATEVPNIWIDLQTNQWTGYVISLTADTTSQKITTVEFANNLLNLPGTIGISGILHQSWVQPAVGSSTRNPTPASSVSSPDTAGSEVDSYFLNQGYYNVSVANPFTENNNLTNVASTPPFIGSPLPDEPAFLSGKTVVVGADYGVGSNMSFTGAANVNTATQNLNLAFVIVPRGGQWVQGNVQGAYLLVNGAALDPANNAFPIVYSYVIPEPASLGLLAIGGLGLLARRRRHA